MEEKLTVKLAEDTLYDFMLFHTYSKFAGFLSNILGMAVAFMGIIMMVMGRISSVRFIFYLIAALVFIAYTPVSLMLRAKKQMKNNPEYQTPKEYTFGEEGIWISQNEKEENYTWDQIEKVVATPKDIGIYYGPNDAMILPKEQFGDKFIPIMNIITSHITREKVKIR